MHQHKHDENSAPNQADDQGDRPHAVAADRARGAAGAEPPLEAEPAKVGHRHDSAAGLYSIWETTHRGLRDMGVKRSLRTLLAINQKGDPQLARVAHRLIRKEPDDRFQTAEEVYEALSE